MRVLRHSLLSLLLLLTLLLPALSDAVTMTALTSGSDTTDGTSWTTASITPSANKLVIAAVLNALNPPGTVTLAGNSLTYVEIANITFGIATNSRRITLFRAMGASPTSGAITITASASQNGVIWSIVEFGDVDTSGTNGSGAVVQSATNRADTAASLTVTLAAFGGASNATYGVFGMRAAAGTFTQGTGFTEIHDVTLSTPSTAMATEWRSDNDTSVDATPSVTDDLGGIAIEIKAAAAAADFGVLKRRGF